MNVKGRLVRDERGVGLVVIMLGLTILSLLAMMLMTSVTTESRLTSNNISEASALNVAEAGIAEATTRIADGTIDFGANPRGTAVIFNSDPGNVPVVGPDTTAIATTQPAGAWLSYSTATKTPDALTVSYKTNSAKTQIYKYDPTKNPPVQTASGSPIYLIRSTGHSGQVVRRVTTEVVQKPMIITMLGAVAANVPVKFTGNAVVCGYNHAADTPTGTGKNGRAGIGGCNEDPGAQQWEIASGDKTGIWTTKAINNGGGAQSFGTPGQQPNQAVAGFYSGPWNALGMSQAEFYPWVGTRQSTAPVNPNGILYLDNNSVTQDQSGSYAFNGGTGSGFLYVDGSLTLNSTFNYRGFIYVEGNLKLNGQAWILGGLVVRGKTELKNNGGATVLYSYDGIQQSIARYTGRFITLSWREM